MIIHLNILLQMIVIQMILTYFSVTRTQMINRQMFFRKINTVTNVYELQQRS